MVSMTWTMMCLATGFGAHLRILELRAARENYPLGGEFLAREAAPASVLENAG